MKSDATHACGTSPELKAFQRVTLVPGESKLVDFTIRAADLRFIGTANEPVVEPGNFRVWIPPSARTEGVNGSFVLA